MNNVQAEILALKDKTSTFTLVFLLLVPLWLLTFSFHLLERKHYFHSNLKLNYFPSMLKAMVQVLPLNIFIHVLREIKVSV